MSETPRMWIDVRPPVNPENGDIWIARGELRTWRGRAWDPPWTPEPMPRGYPKPGRRKKVKPEPSSSQAPA